MVKVSVTLEGHPHVTWRVYHRPTPRTGVHMTSYRDLNDTLDQLSFEQKLAIRVWEHLGAPSHMVKEACTHVMANGEVPDLLTDELASYYKASPAKIRGLFTALGDACESMVWDNTRIALTIDPTMWEELDAVRDDDLVSADVFKYLPYDNPYLHFPVPFVFPTRDPKIKHQVIGCYVYGMRRRHSDRAQIVCSTSHPEAHSVTFKFPGILIDENGEHVQRNLAKPHLLKFVNWDIVWTTSALRFASPVATFGQLADTTRANFTNRDPEGGKDHLMMDVEPAVEQTIEVIRKALAYVMYLCCSNADLKVRQKPQNNNRKRQQSRTGGKPLTVVDVGYTVGADIRAWRIEQERTRSSEPTGRGKRPHPRRAHYHRWRYGPGREQLSQPRFMPMLWVNAGDPDAKKKTIKRVRTD